MPAASTRLRLLAALVVTSLTVTGCQTLDDAGRAIGHADLVNDLASRLDQALTLTYSADYQLAAGQTATIAQAQEPARSAYTWPGGKLTVTEDATTRCETTGGRTVCTLEPPPAGTTKPSVTVFTEAERQGLVTPPAVVGLLTAAALDPDASITSGDTTLAGRHATCVEVSGSADDFNACVTTDGALASFTGQVDGKPVDLALTRYRESVESTAFDPPPGAGMVDRRPAGS